MRDVELLVRYLAYHRFLSSYEGRIKDFLDLTCLKLNDTWAENEASVRHDIGQFNLAVDCLISIFGDELARKPGSRSFNRAIFDALIFYAADKDIREAMDAQRQAVQSLYSSCLANEDFALAVESDTAGIPHTYSRLSIWGKGLQATLAIPFNVPALEDKTEDAGNRISFDGFR